MLALSTFHSSVTALPAMIEADAALTKFESGDLTGICELDHALVVLRETRSRLGLLMENETVLDDFDM